MEHLVLADRQWNKSNTVNNNSQDQVNCVFELLQHQLLAVELTASTTQLDTLYVYYYYSFKHDFGCTCTSAVSLLYPATEGITRPKA